LLHEVLVYFVALLRPPPLSTLFPYTTLFRSPYVPAMTQASGEDLKRRFGTRAVHAGHIPDPLAGAVMTPIYQTSTYIQEGLGRHKGYEYARTRNPCNLVCRLLLEKKKCVIVR